MGQASSWWESAAEAPSWWESAAESLDRRAVLRELNDTVRLDEPEAGSSTTGTPLDAQARPDQTMSASSWGLLLLVAAVAVGALLLLL